MADDGKPQNIWQTLQTFLQTLPGILTAAGTLVGVVTTLFLVLNSETRAPGPGLQTWKYDGRLIRLIKSGSEKCLDVPVDDQYRDRTVVEVFDCYGSPQQTWTFAGGALKSGAGKCLDVPKDGMDKNGTKVEIYGCNNSPQQQWSFDGGAIKSETGRCLDVPPPYENRTQVRIWDCYSSNQHQSSRVELELDASRRHVRRQ